MMDKKAFLKWLKTQGNHEYTHMFAETAYNNVRNTVMNGQFDKPYYLSGNDYY
jgi:hypothetical protein